MKTLTILCLTMLITTFVFAQDKSKQVKEIKVTPPLFTGVNNAAEIYQQQNFTSFDDYLRTNLKYPEDVFKRGAEGTEVVHFEVSADGKLADFRVISSVSTEIDAAIYEILKTTCGMWKPGETNGEPMPMEKEVAIVFKWKEFEQLHNTKDFDALAKHYLTKGTKQLLTKNNPKKALKLFNHGIKYRPNEDCLLMARGLCKYELEDKKGALADWSRMRNSGIDNEVLTTINDFKELKGYEDLALLLQSK